MVTSSRWDKVTLLADWALRIAGVISFIAVSLLYVQVGKVATCNQKVNEAQNTRARNLDGDLTRERNASRRVDDALAAIVAASLASTPPLATESRRLITELGVALASQAKARADADEARRLNPPIAEPATAC